MEPNRHDFRDFSIMIRALHAADVDKVADIWLSANLQAHSFIPAEYWEGNLESVKSMFPQAEVYVYEDDHGIQGFIGLNGEHIEGVFVSGRMRSHGIGRCLMDYAKRRKTTLTLNVYQRNIRAIRFYLREGFEIQRDSLDAPTGEREYVMAWQRSRTDCEQ